MSYLSHYATRRLSIRRRGRDARVDERVRLNLPGFHGEASVRVFVEDTTGRPVQPRLRLRVSDCFHEIALEFEVGDHAARENSLHKIHTLIGALERFRDGLAAEAELAARRERHLTTHRR